MLSNHVRTMHILMVTLWKTNMPWAIYSTCILKRADALWNSFTWWSQIPISVFLHANSISKKHPKLPIQILRVFRWNRFKLPRFLKWLTQTTLKLEKEGFFTVIPRPVDAHSSETVKIPKICMDSILQEAVIILSRQKIFSQVNRSFDNYGNFR